MNFGLVFARTTTITTKRRHKERHTRRGSQTAEFYKRHHNLLSEFSRALSSSFVQSANLLRYTPATMATNQDVKRVEGY